MKILMINDYGNDFGGTESYLFSLRDHLSKLDHEVVILSSNFFPNKFMTNQYSFNGFNNERKYLSDGSNV